MNSLPRVLLTGASGGIGSSIASLLRAKGVTVVATDSADADLSSYDDSEALAERVIRDGDFDWVVYAHGFIDGEKDFFKQSPEAVEDIFAVNAVSIVQLTRLLLPHARGFIFISSTAALSPNGRYAAYSASKAAVNAFAEALARNLPQQIFVTICPGPTRTPMRAKVADDVSSSQPPEIVAETVIRLITGESPYKSGDVVVVKDSKDFLCAKPQK